MISVIVPVYNVEKYLAECLDSILNQTYTDLEIICVNDGSTDNSLTILNEYAKKDNRIKVISQHSGGASVARNTGIKHSTSEYLTFVDSDDIIKPTYMETLWVNKDKADCIQVNMEIFSTEMKINFSDSAWFKEFNLRNSTDIINITYKDIPYIFMTSWGKLFKKSILQKYNITFYEGVINEDYAYTYEYLFHCKTFYNIPNNLYLYRKRFNSVSNKENLKRLFDIAKVFIHLIKHIKKYDNKIFRYRKFILTILRQEGKINTILKTNTLQSTYYIHKLAKLLNIKYKIFRKLLEVENIRVNISNPINDKKIKIYNTNFTKYKYEYPEWFKNGITLITKKNNIQITYKTSKNIILEITILPNIILLKNKTLKINSLTINKEKKIITPIYITHDLPYKYNIDTQNNEFIEIFVNYEVVDNYKPLKQSQIELITEENTPLSITSKTKLEIMEYKYPNCEKNLKAIILHTNKRHFKFKILNPNQQNIFSRFTSNVWDNQGNKFLPVLYNYIKINKKNYISNILADKFHPIELILDQKNIEIEIKNKIKHLNNNNNIKD